MKYLPFVFSYCLFCKISFAQTYITPALGYDFMSIKSVFTDPDFHRFKVLSSPYSIGGIQYEAELEQIIYKKLSASTYLSFAQRQAEASVFSPIPIDGFKFNYWRSGISINLKATNNLSIGIGYDYNKLKNLTYTFGERSYYEFESYKVDHGLNASIRGYWKKIVFKTYLHYGLNNNISNSTDDLTIRPVNYFGISLGYKIKILNSFKKPKKVECPAF